MMNRVGILSLFNLLSVFVGVVLLGCYESSFVPLCKEDAECLSGDCRDGRCVSSSFGDGDKDEDTESDSLPSITSNYSEPLTGVDVLFVIDSSSTMLYEQGIMGSAIRVFLIKLTEQLLGGMSMDLAAVDARLAVTSSDMGLSFEKNPTDDSYALSYFENCSASGFGDDGAMRIAYSPDYNWDRPCPSIDPFVTDDMFLTLKDNSSYQTFVDAMTCMMPTGLHGCSLAQPLRAGAAAITKHGQDSFLRKNALTVFIFVSDKDDCSIESAEWFDAHGNNGDIYESCAADNELLYSPRSLKRNLIGAKTAETGVNAEGSILFAAITGVPFSDDCQGRGDQIDNCKNVSLPTGGTMDDPYRGIDTEHPERSSIINGYACEVWSGDGDGLVQAQPGMRMVQVAQEFGELGYVYSICNENWGAAMSDIAVMIGERVE